MLQIGMPFGDRRAPFLVIGDCDRVEDRGSGSISFFVKIEDRDRLVFCGSSSGEL